MNDPTELAIGEDSVKMIVEELAKASSSDSHEFGIFTKLKNFCDLGGINQSADFYVASFSSQPDSLSQWRGYGKDGHGFAVGLRQLSQFAVPGLPMGETATLLQCIYDEETFQERVRSELTMAIEHVFAYCRAKEKNPAGDLEIVEKAVLPYLLGHIVTLVLARKHEAYRDEQEWRLVVVRTGTQRQQGVNY